ncbi:MAG TPA: heme exporter protein CcmB, partial [Acidimicrobiia bacterium]|nr:heme exporter protein CcmB [Acidimicrobiia bacterium]
AAAIAVELFLLEIVVGLCVVVMYDVSVQGGLMLLCTAVTATIGLAATGTVYGVLAGGLRARDTLVPLLVLPAVMPVMLGATRAFQAALAGVNSDGWPWVQLLTAFAILVVAAGTVAFGPLLEEG